MRKSVDDRFSTFAIINRHVAKFEEAAEYVNPSLWTDKENADEQAETQHDKNFGSHDYLQHVVNFASDENRQHHQPEAQIS